MDDHPWGREVSLAAVGNQTWSVKEPIASIRQLTPHGLLWVEQSVYLQVRALQRLKAAIPELVDGSGLVKRCRAVKSTLEIDAMRRAAELTVEGMRPPWIQSGRASRRTTSLLPPLMR